MTAGTTPTPLTSMSPEEAVEGATRSFNYVELRLLMKEREDLAKLLIEVDWNIWKLEESFRTATP